MYNKFITRLRVLPAIVCLLAVCVTSCLDGNDVDYSDWKKDNIKYVEEAKNSLVDGKPEYETVVPVFAPKIFILMKWHNDRELTKNNLKPLDNSTIDCKYICTDIEGNYIDSSFLSTTYGDSIFRTRPTKNISGFWTALTNMHVGDSVTVIIPSEAGYGSISYSKVKPFSTLVYGIKLTGIPGYELPD